MSTSIKHPVAKVVAKIADRTHNRRSDVFRQAVEMCFCALAQRAPGGKAKAEDLEARYMRAMKPYVHDEVRHQFPEFMAELTVLLAKGGADPLGQAAGEIEALDGNLGQFFTPYEVSRMMAEITLGDAAGIVEREGFITLMEPASGAGGMVLAAADTLRGMGIDVATQVSVHAQDLSDLCYQMTYVQLYLANVPALVVHGNSLSNEVFDHSFTHAAGTFHQKHGTLFKRTGAATVSLPPRHRQRPPRHRSRA